MLLHILSFVFAVDYYCRIVASIGRIVFSSTLVSYSIYCCGIIINFSIIIICSIVSNIVIILTTIILLIVFLMVFNFTVVLVFISLSLWQVMV